MSFIQTFLPQYSETVWVWTEVQPGFWSQPCPSVSSSDAVNWFLLKVRAEVHQEPERAIASSRARLLHICRLDQRWEGRQGVTRHAPPRRHCSGGHRHGGHCSGGHSHGGHRPVRLQRLRWSNGSQHLLVLLWSQPGRLLDFSSLHVFVGSR